jgi:hypothetical protein
VAVERGASSFKKQLRRARLGTKTPRRRYGFADEETATACLSGGFFPHAQQDGNAPTQSQPQATTPREQPRIAPPELSPRDADQYEEYLQRAEDFDLRRDWRPFMIWAE